LIPRVRSRGALGARARPDGRSRLRARALSTLAALLVLSAAPAARAQLGFGQPGMGGMGSQQPAATPKKPAGPETHAASGAEGAQLQTQEPTLPENPTQLSDDVRDAIGSDAETTPAAPVGNKIERRFFPPYYSESSGRYTFKTIFPLWAQRTQGNDRATLFPPFYYNRRSPNVDVDILWPIVGRLRIDTTTTTVVGPFVHSESPGTPARGDQKAEPGFHRNWMMPLFFEGRSDDGSGYLHVPPLLTFTTHTARDGFNLAGPLYCKWKGGPACDPRTADDLDLGLFPLYFYGRNDRSEYELIPPLLHYYRYNDVGDSSLSLWGPYLRKHSRESDTLDLLPIFWRTWGKNEDHITVFPLFHRGYTANSTKLITPLFYYSTEGADESTFATYVYARHRGRTKLDMVTPLFWRYRDPDIGLDRQLLFPLFYHSSSPRSNDLVLFPLYAHFHEPGISESRWVTPLFRQKTDLTGWETDIFPFFYIGRENRSTHLVAAPILWDFASPHSHTTVVLPVYVRSADEAGVSQLALNTYYHEQRVPGGKSWEFHFFPLFSYGETPNGHWWNVLYGLAGYTREGTMAKMRAAYIPITLSP
jgi:hypothetical protein